MGVLNWLLDSWTYPLFPDRVDLPTQTWSTTYSVGGGSDSFYEYLLKLYLFTGDERLRERYELAV
jgi:hypothetical protein